MDPFDFCKLMYGMSPIPLYFDDNPKANIKRKRRHPRHDRSRTVGRVRRKHHRQRKAA